MSDKNKDARREAFGRRLKELRKRNALNRVQAAEEMGIAPSQLDRYEDGQNAPSFERLCVMAVCLEVTLEDLVDVDAVVAYFHPDASSQAQD